MAKFPEPPSPETLAAITPELRSIPAGTLLWRLYFRGGRHPRSWREFRAFGPTSARFDHQLLPRRVQTREIFYCAGLGATCLAEVFQSSRVIDRVTDDPWLVAFRLARLVTVLDLGGTWPTRAGASMALSSGPRPRARRWSRTIYQAYPQVEGLLYPSSMNANRATLALYERAAGALPASLAFHRPLDDPGLLLPLEKVALELGYRLV